MQVEESMIHFPSQRYSSIDSPSAVYSPAISDCGGGGDASMSVDPSITSTPISIAGCYATEGVTDFHPPDGYDTQLYTMQPPTSTYPISDFDRLDLNDLDTLFGAPTEMEQQLVNTGSPRPLEGATADEHMRRAAVHAAQQRPVELERSNSLSQGLLTQQQPPHLQHSLSMRVVSASSSRPAGRTSRHVHVTNGGARSHQHRSSKPVFPTESVPLQQVSRRERPPSATPSVQSTRSDPFDTRSTCRSILGSIGAASDPGYAYSVQSRDSGTGSVCSAPGGLQSNISTGDVPGDTESTRACMEVEMNVKDVKRIIELDKKILKLQAERSKLVEKASQSSARADSPTEQYGGVIGKPQELVRVHLFFVPVGIHILDEPVFEEASTLLRRIGGKYFDLERAIATLRNICCKGMVVVPDFSTCFAYIKSLLHEVQRLQLSDNGGIYQIELDGGANGGGQAVPQEFTDALFMANRVLHTAQAITHSYHTIQSQLQKVQVMARDRSEACDSLCQQIGLLERDRRSQIKSVLDGNFSTITTAVRVWPQYYRAATETIHSITQCIHPANI